MNVSGAQFKEHGGRDCAGIFILKLTFYTVGISKVLPVGFRRLVKIYALLRPLRTGSPLSAVILNTALSRPDKSESARSQM